MSSWVISAIAFACMFLAAMGAMLAARHLPEQHVSKETQDAVKLGVGMIAAMASLILGLMTASVKGAFDTTDHDVHTYATTIRSLDSTLRHYGPDAAAARQLLDQYGRTVLAETWQGQGAPQPGTAASSEQVLDRLDGALHALAPANDEQQRLRSAALSGFDALVTTRWTVQEESVTTIPPVFTVVLVIWLTLIFLSFGLFAPSNAVSIAALFLCSLSIGGSLFLIMEMSGPFDGFISISPKAMSDAITAIERPDASVATVR